MLKTTPLRLVAIEETPSDEDQSATPIAAMTEAEAITRRVPNAEIIAAQDGQAASPKRLASKKKPVAIAALAAVVVLTTGIVVLATRGHKTPTPPAPPTAPTMQTLPPVPPQPVVAAPTPIPLPTQAPAAVPEVIRLEVTADPKEAELSLDGNVLAGHRLNLRVPKDRGIHVVSASAPGYIPFNQQVSFAGDVVLSINLRRGHAPAVRQPTRARPAQSEPTKAPSDGHATGPSRAAPRVEPGMSLEGPTREPNAKPIDERNPYRP